MIYQNVLEMIGNTKLLKLNRLSQKYKNHFYCKIEAGNPFGSVKDRVAFQIIHNAINNKQINQNTTVIEATSGNTGIAIAAVCLFYKIACIIVMPENMSAERIKLLRHMLAKV